MSNYPAPVNDTVGFLVLLKIHPYTQAIEYCYLGGGDGSWTKNLCQAKQYLKPGPLKAIVNSHRKWMANIQDRIKKDPTIIKYYSNQDRYPDQPFEYRIVPAEKKVTLDWSQELIV